MSLDVHLMGEEYAATCTCRECFNEHTYQDRPCYYSANITHNLNNMADEAGLYYYLWRPGELGICEASQLIEPLERGLRLLESKPDYFGQFNPANGWGSYEGLVRFVQNYLEACKMYPDAFIQVGR